MTASTWRLGLAAAFHHRRSLRHVARPSPATRRREASSSSPPATPRPGCRRKCCSATRASRSCSTPTKRPAPPSGPTGVVIATDHAEIAREVERFGGDGRDDQPRLPERHRPRRRSRPPAAATPRSSSTCKATSRRFRPTAIDRVIELLEKNPAAGMATLATPIRAPEQLTNPACVKVVFDDAGRALYFSRSPIPFVRDPGSDSQPFNQPPDLLPTPRPLRLPPRRRCCSSPRCRPRRSNRPRSSSSCGCCNRAATILVDVVEHASSGIDTPADYAAFVARRKAG